MQQRGATTRPAHYRPDIDGLRAIAVLGVVAFHYDLTLPRSFGLWLGHTLHRPSGLVSLFPRGGFVGVDIFFVISGYLIGGILLREQKNHGTISLKRFYERRIRRILPAFLAVLLFTEIAAWVGDLPSQMKEFAKSALAAVLSCSNFYFWKTSGYFDAPSQTQPLLHTWSLAVEEQFYLLFPLLLMAMKRFTKSLQVAAFSLAALLSLAGSIRLLNTDASGAFYLPVSRAWELLAGVLLASGLVPVPKRETMRNLTGLIGAALIGYAMFRYTRLTPFPGPAAVLPCLGAVLLIAAGSGGGCQVSRLLAWRPLVGIGLVSYSLYLWHWPLLLANRYEWFIGFRVQQWVLVLLLAPVSYLSWLLIEQPFRVDGFYISRKTLVVSAASIAVALAMLNGWLIAPGGMPSRFSAEALSLNEALNNAVTTGAWKNECFVSAGRMSLENNCLQTSATKPNVLLFGDSQAAQLWSGLAVTYPEVNFAVATGSSCKPLLASYESRDEFCRRLVHNTLTEFLPAHHVSTVVLASLWADSDVPSLAETLKQISSTGVRTYVIGPGTYYDQPLPALLYREGKSGSAGLTARHLKYSDEEYRQLEQAMSQAGRLPGVSFLSLHGLLCDGKSSCLVYAAPEVPLQFDAIHLSRQGSLLVAQRLKGRHLLP